MNKLFLVLLTSLVSSTLVFSQKESSVYLNGYDQANYYKYFDSIHSINKGAIKDLTHSYKCYLIFKIDTNADLNKVEFIEIPDAPLPEIAKKYIRQLFISTNGSWSANDNLKNFSKDLFFSVSILKSNQSAADRIADYSEWFEFALSGLARRKELKEYNLQDEINITLLF